MFHSAASYATHEEGSSSSREDIRRGKGVAAPPKEFPIFLTSGGRTKRVDWAGKSFEDLANLYFQVFSVDKDRIQDKIRRGHFYLKHNEFNVFFEGFELTEVSAGSVIEVRGPHALEPGAAAWEVDPDPTGSVLSLESEEQDSDEEMHEHLDIGDDIDAKSEARSLAEVSRLGRWRHVVWKTLEDPGYSKLAKYITVFIMIVILVSTTAFIVQTLPMFQTQNQQNMNSSWYVLETACIIVFTVEFLLRVLCAPARLLSLKPLNLMFFADFMNVIDLVAIIPYYVELGFSSSRSVPGLAILRVVRLVRIFRLFKVSKGAATIFLVTMKRSAKPLYMLIFFTSLALIIFSSLMYYAERGTYDENLGVYRRILEYICEVDVEVLHPDTAKPVEMIAAGNATDAEEQYLASAADWLLQLEDNELQGSDCRRADAEHTGPVRGRQNLTQAFADDVLGRSFVCFYPYNYNYEALESETFEDVKITYRSRKHDCSPMFEVSPFESIPATMWWCLVTMTTVGYGDMYPIRWYGRMLGMVVMLSGILVIALPITVIGSNFAEVYAQMELRKASQGATTPEDRDAADQTGEEREEAEQPGKLSRSNSRLRRSGSQNSRMSRRRITLQEGLEIT